MACVSIIISFSNSLVRPMPMALQPPLRLTQNQFSLIIYIIMSPCRKNANCRPAAPLSTLFGNE